MARSETVSTGTLSTGTHSTGTRSAGTDSTGTAAPWPRTMLGIGRELTPQQELACALRLLAAHGWAENIAGHITWVQAGTSNLWVNPWGIWWEETKASDICLVSADGELLEGRWDVTPAVWIHTELHRARPDARVVIHNHPYYATLLAGLGEMPRIVHQNQCVFDGELALVDEYAGVVEDADAGQWLAAKMGSATGAILVSHGAVVTGSTMPEACYQAVQFERMCRMTYDCMVAGRTPVEIPAVQRAAVKPVLRQNPPLPFWNGAVRQLIAREPEVLQ